MTDRIVSEAGDGVAVIGMTGRFPMAANLEEFWHNVRSGVECITFFSNEQLEAAGWDAALLHRPDVVKARGVLDGVEQFDAQFFGYLPREADVMDPQQRLFLECVWEALEQAGYDPLHCPGLVGVYAGSGPNTYYVEHLLGRVDLFELVGGVQIATSNERDHLTTRVSYKLNLKGPSYAIQTACSTSLVSVVLACQELLHYSCDMAIAGGSSITLPQVAPYQYLEGGIQSPDGHCRAFDAAAQGTLTGSGVGVVILKRLEDALADGDYIHAVIKGSAVNNDGAAKVGYPAPSVDGQAEVIALAQALAQVDPDTITYVEAHGTGTTLGDPIEVAALTQAFRASTARRQFCALGSVKSNVGHLDYAAGVTGLIKTVLAMEHKELPPSLHFSQPNPRIDFAHSPFYVNDRLQPWPEGSTPRRAGVSSFGVGGTNAHAVLEEGPPREGSGPARPVHLLTLSAKTAEALEQATSKLAEHLRTHPDLNMADVAYTLQVGRNPFAHRRALVCADQAEAIAALETREPGQVVTGSDEQPDRPVAFLFPGQGSQHANMGHDLYEHEPVFRREVDRCSEVLHPLLGRDLRQLLYPAAQDATLAERELEQTALAQPALFVVEYALARTWQHWGIQPQAMVGHSIGEYVAACLAGVFSLDDALALVAVRGRLMQRLPGGSMLAVPLPEADLQPLLGTELAVAAINGPNLCVVSGPPAAVQGLEQQLARGGIAGIRLHTSHAFHSSMVDPVLAPFTEELRRVKLTAPAIPFLSNVSGTWITAEQATDAAYWAAHLRQTVRFAGAVAELLRDGARILLEVGPSTALSRIAGQHPARTAQQVIAASMRHPRDLQSDERALLQALGRLWAAGVTVNWPGLYAEERRLRLPLPTYPFQRRRHWIEALGPRAAAPDSVVAHGPKRPVKEWFYLPSWQRSVAPILPVPDQADTKERWLVFRDAEGLGALIEARLRANGHAVTSVLVGERFAQLGDRLFSVRPAERSDYRALLGALAAPPTAVAHFWTATRIEPAHGAAWTVDARQETGLFSLLALGQVLGEQAGGPVVRIAVVSHGLQSLAGEAVGCPANATILAPCRVLPQEYPQLICRSVDVELPATASIAEAHLVEQLIAELSQETSGTTVAYRGRQRWTQTYIPAPLEAPPDAAAGLRQRGVYLITGGLGGIGLVLAGYLARTVQAKLVLVGRSAFPERTQWDTWLAGHEPADPTSRRIRTLQGFQAAGAEVMLVSADVADLAQMRTILSAVTTRFGSVNGIIHGAGLTSATGMQPVAEVNRAAVEAHFRPKMQGLAVLDQLFQGQSLDFRVILSSLSTVLGGLNLVAYAAANLLVDAFATARQQEDGAPWLSVDWDAWNLAGVGGHSAAGLQEQQAIRADEGIDAFRRLLAAGPLGQVVVSTSDLQGRIDQWITLSSVREAKTAQVHTERVNYERPVLRTEYVAPRTDVERQIATVWQEVLGIARVGRDDNFFELGGHSLLAIQLISRLRATFQVDLSVHSLFDSPTVAEVAEIVSAQFELSGDQSDDLDDLLAMVEQLSDEEVRLRLAQPKG